MSRRWLLVVGVLAAALVAGVLRSAATDRESSDAGPSLSVAQTADLPIVPASGCTISSESEPSWSQAERITPAPASATDIGAAILALVATDAASSGLHQTEQAPPSRLWSSRWFARPPPRPTSNL